MLIKSVEWVMLIVPWFSLFFLKREKVKQYMPVSIFTTLLVTMYHEIAFTQKYWVVNHQTIFPWLITYASFVYGLFLIGTLWIFYFTFGRFWVYFLTNLIIDGAFLLVFSFWFEKMGFYHLVNRSHWMVLIDWSIISLIAYGYQLWQSGAFKQGKARPKHGGDTSITRKSFDRKPVRHAKSDELIP